MLLDLKRRTIFMQLLAATNVLLVAERGQVLLFEQKKSSNDPITRCWFHSD